MTGNAGDKSLLAWVVFHVIVLSLLAFDLGVVNRKARSMRLAESLFWNVVWTSIGLLFGVFVLWHWGHTAGVEYYTGYVLERALSVDNIFVFVIIFRYFAVPADYQHRVLYWGILGALMMRGALILAGAVAVARFHWVLYLFGAFLVWTGVHMLFQEEKELHPEKNPFVRLAARIFPVSASLQGPKLFVRLGGKLHATPLLIVLLVVETSDLIFAFDSIPAIFGVTRDPYIIYTSNVFAILGLRAMYFLVASLLPLIRHLKYGLSAILVFIGARMLIARWIEIPTGLTLAVVCVTLVLSVASSFLPRRR